MFYFLINLNNIFCLKIPKWFYISPKAFQLLLGKFQLEKRIHLGFRKRILFVECLDLKKKKRFVQEREEN